MHFKGHGKSKSSYRSYRCLSLCPFLSKSLDKWILKLREEKWSLAKADTQFLTKGSCHELASVLLTECIQHSVRTLRKPLFCLFLDKMSAFDLVTKENIVLADVDAVGGPAHADHISVYLANRLGNRRTYLQYQDTIMGDIKDTMGCEQGGILGSEEFQLLQ